jgi:hypothetical protein
VRPRLAALVAQADMHLRVLARQFREKPPYVAGPERKSGIS